MLFIHTIHTLSPTFPEAICLKQCESHMVRLKIRQKVLQNIFYVPHNRVPTCAHKSLWKDQSKWQYQKVPCIKNANHYLNSPISARYPDQRPMTQVRCRFPQNDLFLPTPHWSLTPMFLLIPHIHLSTLRPWLPSKITDDWPTSNPPDIITSINPRSIMWFLWGDTWKPHYTKRYSTRVKPIGYKLTEQCYPQFIWNI